MSIDIDKKRVRKQREVVPARRDNRSAGPAARVATLGAQSAVEELDPAKNPSWRLTAEGQKTSTTPPWLLVTLAFGLPFVLLIVLSFLI